MSRFATIVAEEWLTGIILGRWMLSSMLDPWGVLVAVGGIAQIAVLILKVFVNRLQNCTCVLPFSVVVGHNQHFIFLILSACLFLNAQTCDQRLQREFFGLVVIYTSIHNNIL